MAMPPTNSSKTKGSGSKRAQEQSHDKARDGNSSPESGQGSNGSKEPKRKRVRISFSCVPCKKRKVKCSRSRPVCLACVKSRIANCYYEEADWSRLLADDTNGNENKSPINQSSADSPENPSLVKSMAAVHALAGSVDQPDKNANIASPSEHSYRGSSSSDTGSRLSDRTSSSYNGLREANGSLKNDLDAMKDMIRNLESRLQAGTDQTSYKDIVPFNLRGVAEEGYPSGPAIGLLNEKLDIIKINNVFHKKTRTLYFGPTAMRTEMRVSGIPGGIMPFFFTLLNDERRKFKAEVHKKKPNYALPMFNYGDSPLTGSPLPGQSEANFSENLIARFPKTAVLLELIEFFEDKLTYHLPFIDMGMVRLYYKEYFSTSKDGNLVFNKPTKGTYYSKVAVVLGVAAIALLIASYDDEAKIALFPDESVIHNRVYYLFLESLNLSRFMKKQSIPALQSLIILRILQVYDPFKSDGGDETNSYLYFQSALAMAYSVGMHRDPNKIMTLSHKGDFEPLQISKEKWRLSWRYLNIMDITYSATIGVPLAINEETTDCEYICQSVPDLILKKGYKILRKIAYHMSTKVAPISLNDLMNLLNELLRFMRYDIESFNSLLKKTPENLKRQDEISLLLAFKLECLYHVLTLSSHLRLICRDKSLINSSRATPLTPLETDYLQDLCQYYSFQTMKAAMFAYFVLEKISNPESSLEGKPLYMVILLGKNRKLLVRGFLCLVHQALATSFASSSNDNKPSASKEDSGSTPVLTVDSLTYQLEQLMYTAISGDTRGNETQMELVKRAMASSKNMIAYVCEICIKCMKNCPILAKDYGFYVTQRSLLMICWYAMKRAEKCDDSFVTRRTSFCSVPHDPSLFFESVQQALGNVQKQGEANPGDIEIFLSNPEFDMKKVEKKETEPVPASSTPSTNTVADSASQLSPSNNNNNNGYATNYPTISNMLTLDTPIGVSEIATPEIESMSTGNDILDPETRFADLNTKSQEFYNWLVSDDFESTDFSKFLSSAYAPPSDNSTNGNVNNNSTPYGYGYDPGSGKDTIFAGFPFP